MDADHDEVYLNVIKFIKVYFNLNEQTINDSLQLHLNNNPCVADSPILEKLRSVFLSCDYNLLKLLWRVVINSAASDIVSVFKKIGEYKGLSETDFSSPRDSNCEFFNYI